MKVKVSAAGKAKGVSSSGPDFRGDRGLWHLVLLPRVGRRLCVESSYAADVRRLMGRDEEKQSRVLGLRVNFKSCT